MSIWQAIQEIRRSGGAKLYLLLGTGDGLASQLLEQEILLQAREQREVDSVRYQWPLHSLEQVVSEAFSGSLFGSQLVVSLRDLECLTTSFKGKWVEEEQSALKWLMSEPPEFPVILSAAGEKLDERKKLVKSLQNCQYARIVYVHKLTDEEARAFFLEWLGPSTALTRAQLDETIRRSGRTLAMLATEAEKMRVYLSDRTQISDEELRTLVIDAEQNDVFMLIRLLLAGHAAEAYERYVLQHSQESVFGFMALLSRQYRLIAQVQDAIISQLPDAQVAARVGAHPYAVKMAREQARKIPHLECLAVLTELADMEYGIKSGRLMEQTAMQLFFLRRMKGLCASE